MSHGEKSAVEHGRYLEERRLDLGLKWSEVARDMERLHGVSVTADYLSKIKRGAAPLSKMSVDAREALRQVLRIAPYDWETETGLYSPASEVAAPRSVDNIQQQARRGPPIPPVVPHRETPVVIPPELQEVIDEYGGTYPELREPTIQKIIAAPRNFGGPDNGPQTKQDWLEYFLVTRRYLR